MLYGMLHKDASTPVKLNQLNNQNMKKLSANTSGLCLLSLKLLNQIIVLDLTLFQVKFLKNLVIKILFFIF